MITAPPSATSVGAPRNAPTITISAAADSTSFPRVAREGIMRGLAPRRLVADLAERLGDHGRAGRALELGVGGHEDAVGQDQRRELADVVGERVVAAAQERERLAGVE